MRTLNFIMGRDLNLYLLVYLTSVLLFICPTLCSCSKYDEQVKTTKSKIETRSAKFSLNVTSKQKINCLDIFFFSTDSTMRLDSYERLDNWNGKTIECASRRGAKHLVIIANSSKNEYTWSNINSYESLKHNIIELKNETIQQPIMFCERSIIPSKHNNYRMSLRPNMSRICLKSISFNLKNSAYENSELENVKVYLTNVSSNTYLIDNEYHRTTSYINQKKFKDFEIKTLKDPTILSSSVKSNVGKKKIYPNITLYCYSNVLEKTDISSAFTRIVIEGTIEGTTYYYPIEIKEPVPHSYSNNENEYYGIIPNMEYDVDITITKLGSTNPDIPVESGVAKAVFSVKDWKDKGSKTIVF